MKNALNNTEFVSKMWEQNWKIRKRGLSTEIVNIEKYRSSHNRYCDNLVNYT